MKAFLALLCAMLAMTCVAGQFTRHSCYQFPAVANCAQLLALRRTLLKLSCPTCVATSTPFRGVALGYDATKDFNCMIKTYYPSPALFTKYQTAEKANAAYTTAKGKAKLNANFMAVGRV